MCLWMCKKVKHFIAKICVYGFMHNKALFSISSSSNSHLQKVTYKLLSHKRYKRNFLCLRFYQSFLCCSTFCLNQLGKCEQYGDKKESVKNKNGFYMHMLTSCCGRLFRRETKSFRTHHVKDEWRAFSLV
jgi:hypothetical protein